mmetsp:Transcript_119/g.451  ORF Transcript_119/g.451 Transcript_119/m.451 type:complete len:226 (+) Transcript_119:501-1178(+)
MVWKVHHEATYAPVRERHVACGGHLGVLRDQLRKVLGDGLLHLLKDDRISPWIRVEAIIEHRLPIPVGHDRTVHVGDRRRGRLTHRDGGLCVLSGDVEVPVRVGVGIGTIGTNAVRMPRLVVDGRRRDDQHLSGTIPHLPDDPHNSRQIAFILLQGHVLPGGREWLQEERRWPVCIIRTEEDCDESRSLRRRGGRREEVGEELERPARVVAGIAAQQDIGVSLVV